MHVTLSRRPAIDPAAHLLLARRAGSHGGKGSCQTPKRGLDQTVQPDCFRRGGRCGRTLANGDVNTQTPSRSAHTRTSVRERGSSLLQTVPQQLVPCSGWHPLGKSRQERTRMVQSGGQRWGWAELCVTGAGHHTGERASQLRGRLGWSGSAAARVMQSE